MSKPTPLKVSAPVRRRPDLSTDKSRGEKKRTDLGIGLSHTEFSSPNPFPVQREVWHHLTAGLAWLSLNDHGRNWPLPRRAVIAQLVTAFDDDLCVQAAREAREIIVSQDRAPNVTALWEKKLRELAEVRATVRDSLEVA